MDCLVLAKAQLFFEKTSFSVFCVFFAIMRRSKLEGVRTCRNYLKMTA
ncbi:hypothetical protein D931_02166 [Enterococcus faecium 13.SD.W.09]|nr:hypothetical protein D931_02166 [Enterococcus faecium 13.SD.W.09]